jgi:hypothetical protein
MNKAVVTGLAVALALGAGVAANQSATAAEKTGSSTRQVESQQLIPS